MRETETAIEDLKKAVEHLHACRATHRASVGVREEYRDQIAWEGVVEVFDVDHPDTDTCYAWSSPVEGSERRKFYAVLKVPPIDSPERAVRASIVKDYRERKAT